MVDFGMDLQAAIIMFEKPMGLWAILEEESLFPKATDKSFEEKLKASLGKLPIFLKPQSKTDKNAHFAISHYAGIVSYNVTGWLEKNKDPVNDSVVEIFKSTSSNPLLVHLWLDHPGQPTTAPVIIFLFHARNLITLYPQKEEAKGKKKKGSGGKTVSSVYLVQLTSLMNTLHQTEPHFIRCIVPNTHKQPGGVEAVSYYCTDEIISKENDILRTVSIISFPASDHAPTHLQWSAGRNQDLHAWIPQQVRHII